MLDFDFFEQLMLLSLSIYTPSHYILASKIEKYAVLYEDDKVNVGFTQANREQGIHRLMAINLMKRKESSVYSFNLTIDRIKNLIDTTIEAMEFLLRAGIPKTRKKSLRNILLLFSEVTVLEPERINWSMRYDRNNQTYRMLITVCYLVLKGLLMSGNRISVSTLDLSGEFL